MRGLVLGSALLLAFAAVSAVPAARAVPSEDGVRPAGFGPTKEELKAAIKQLPGWRADADAGEYGSWVPVEQGHAGNCVFFWTLVTVWGATASSPEQLLFFAGHEWLGTATKEERPYTSVVGGGDTITVEYKYLQGSEPQCCPSGSATVRYRLNPDETVDALDPIPEQAY